MQPEPVLELAAVLAVSAVAGITGYRIAGKYPTRRGLLAVAGFALVAWPILVLLVPDLLWFAFPSFPFGEALFGLAFALIGVLFRAYMDLSRRRILNAVLAAVLAYFVFAEPLFFALSAEEIRTLDGQIVDGVTRQSVHYTCVPASVATVLRTWGIHVREGDAAYALRAAFQGTHPGRVPAVVQQLAGSAGLRARVVSTTLDELRRRDLPVIVLGYSGNIRHATALLTLDDHAVTIGDPASGRRKFSIADWGRQFRWTGQAILVEPAPSAPAPSSRPSLSDRRKG